MLTTRTSNLHLTQFRNCFLLKTGCGRMEKDDVADKEHYHTLYGKPLMSCWVKGACVPMNLIVKNMDRAPNICIKA